MAEKNQKQSESKSKLIPGYRFNEFPNRATRRKMAKRRGVFKTPGLWAYMNRDNENVQTVRRNEK